MDKIKVRHTSIPEESAVKEYLPADYTDTFVCEAEREEPFNAEKIQLHFWTQKRPWVDRLFQLRNTLVKPLGLETGKMIS